MISVVVVSGTNHRVSFSLFGLYAALLKLRDARGVMRAPV
jgi:hypothetical protein